MIGVGTKPAPARVESQPGRSRATERDCWIALSLVPGVGPATFSQLIDRFGSATEAWFAAAPTDTTHEATATPSRGAGARLAAALADARRRHPRDVARTVERATRRIGARVVTALDDRYPPALLTLDPRPPTLYVVGERRAFIDRAVAVVGTRGASGYGLSAATEIADELARAGVVVVSGLALGIDGAAHRAALEAHGRTIAVLPSALDSVYPPRHRALARQIVSRGGALVSEVPIGVAIGKPDFARRNRIVAGLAEAVVVVEAPDRSGALLTAAAAVAIGRELYAVPGPIGAMGSRGCNRLIADHQASIVTSANGLLRQIGVAGGKLAAAVTNISEVEGMVLKHLLERSGSLEELVDRTRQSPAAVASALTLLETRGLASPFGGATFHPTLAARRLSPRA